MAGEGGKGFCSTALDGGVVRIKLSVCNGQG